jgi:beta-barrel assembly-enhancing protease
MNRILACCFVAVTASPVFALDLGNMLDLGKKAMDAGQKMQEASKEYSPEEEIALGEGIASSFLGASALHPDASLQRYVNRVGRWVASQTERPDLPWTFGVIDAETINAFALPGGIVLISHGLLKRLNSESELAGVLAHEIAHVVRKHQLNAIQSGALGDASSSILKQVAVDRIGRSGGGALAQTGKSALASAGIDLVKNGAFLRPLDRGLEYEADRLGVVIAARAGYDPYGLVAVLTMLSTAKAEDATLMLSTHPAPADRIAELERVMGQGLDQYSGQQVEARFKQTVGSK